MSSSSNLTGSHAIGNGPPSSSLFSSGSLSSSLLAFSLLACSHLPSEDCLVGIVAKGTCCLELGPGLVAIMNWLGGQLLPALFTLWFAGCCRRLEEICCTCVIFANCGKCLWSTVHPWMVDGIQLYLANWFAKYLKVVKDVLLETLYQAALERPNIADKALISATS